MGASQTRESSSQSLALMVIDISSPRGQPSGEQALIDGENCDSSPWSQAGTLRSP
jgi:hypothetical protein